MRKVSSLVSSVLLFILLFSTSASALTMRTTSLYQVGRNETINDDLFYAGDTLIIDGTINGDVFAFAESVILNGTVMGNIVTAGNTVQIRGEVTGTVFGLAQRLILDGRVDKNLIAAGSTVAVTKEARVGSNLLAVGDRIQLAGQVGRGAAVAGSEITIGGSIDRELKFAGERLVLDANARIGGPVEYWSDQTAQVAPGATTGEITRHDHQFTFARWERPWYMSGIWTLIKFGGFLVVGLVLLHLFPVLRSRFQQIPLNNPWQAPLAGFLLLVATPVVTILLMITVLGLPLGIITLVSFPVLIYISQVLISWTVGKLIADRVPALRNLAWPVIFVGGAVATSLAAEAPLLGWVFSTAFLFYGLGSLLFLLTRRESPA